MDELPDSIVAHILHALQPRDLSRCMCINRQWRALVPTLAVWSSIARTRWKHWDDKWQPVQAAGQWKQIFDQRLQVRRSRTVSGTLYILVETLFKRRSDACRRTLRLKRSFRARSGRSSGISAWHSSAQCGKTRWCAAACPK